MTSCENREYVAVFYILLLLGVMCMLASQVQALYYQIVLIWELHISPMGFNMMFLIGLFIIILDGG